jgi:hypothetical protein
MENPQPNPLNIGEFKPVSVSENSESIFNSKNFLILFLLFLLTLSFLGINFFDFVANIFDKIMEVLKPVLSQSVSIFNSSAGTLINTSADAIQDVTQATGDIAAGSLQSVGNLLIKSSNDINKNMPTISGPLNISTSQTQSPSQHLDNAVNTSSPPKTEEPKPNATTSPIQTTSPNKGSWCLVGDFKDQRGCVEMREHDKCMSGQVYPSQSLCLNPNLSQNKNP